MKKQIIYTLLCLIYFQYSYSQKYDANFEISEITSDSLINDALFGFSISSASNLLAVGAPADFNATNKTSGKVYIYKRVKNEWILIQKISPPKETSDEKHNSFGREVKLVDSLLFISDFKYRHSENSTSDGVVYYYKIDYDGLYKLHQKLVPPTTSKTGGFGHTIAATRNTVVVSSPFDSEFNGSLYIYSILNDSLKLHQSILSEYEGLMLGYKIALTDDNLFVTYSKPNIYSIAHFRKNKQNNLWELKGKIPSNNESIAGFGSDVYAQNNYLAIGTMATVGKVYLYKIEDELILDTIIDLNNKYASGSANLQLLDNKLLIGYFDNYLVKKKDTIKGGLAFAFEKENNKWKHIKTFSRETPNNNDKFGWGLSITNDEYIISCRRCNIKEFVDCGIVYSFKK